MYTTRGFPYRKVPVNKGYNVGLFNWSIDSIFCIFVVVAIFDIVYDVEAINDLC